MTTKSRFIISDTNHPLIEAEINGISGTFILDTGASTTCIDSRHAELFKLSHGNEGSVTGLGAEVSKINVSYGNKIKIGNWICLDFRVVSVDLSHLNQNLKAHGVRPVEGIIGSDLLIEGKGVIDYAAMMLQLESGL